MRLLKQHAVLSALVIGMASALACSSESGTYTNPGVEGETGVVGMQLQIAPGVTVNTVSWTISNATTGFTKSGTVNVQFSNVVKFQVGGLPSGAGYTITLTATSVDGSITCTGSASFTVVPGATTGVNLILVCTGAAPDSGTIDVNDSTLVCANINSISVFPLETTVDQPVALSATASAGSVTPTFACTATAGTFDNAASATPIFTCPSTPATVTITLTVSSTAPICTTLTTQSV